MQKTYFIHKAAIIVALLCALVGCNNVPLVIKETKLYTDVVNHYSNIDTNAGKHKAAMFLFESMDSKFALYNAEADSVLNEISDTIISKYGTEIRKLTDKEYETKLMLLKNKAPKSDNTQAIFDYTHINSSMLIEHIDITYKNWQRLSQASGASFTDYCEYILPYRVRIEPLNKLCSPQLALQYDKYISDFENTDSIVPTITEFINSLQFCVNLWLLHDYPVTISPQYINTIKLSPRCDELVICMVYILRSMGIPAAFDYTPHWGNHHELGHSWLAVKWQNKWHAFDAVNGNYMSELYRSESIPKVYRHKYSSSNNRGIVKDVTNSYRRVAEANVPIKSESKITPAVAVFNKHNKFRVVGYGTQKQNKFVFKNLGCDVVYFPGSINMNIFTPLGIPFYIDTLGVVHTLKADLNNTITVTLHRKYPLTAGMRYTDKIDWAKSLNGSLIEASNTKLNICDTIVALNNYWSYKEETYTINSVNEYNQVVFKSGSKSQLATLRFFNQNNKVLEGTLINNCTSGDINALFDYNMLSWVNIGNKDSVITIGYKFDTPQKISKVALHARNDANHIVAGDKYELMFWNNGWQSCGVKKANKQEIEFTNVPSSGIYWLKNHSYGVEELPFMIKDNKQFWAGDLTNK